MLSPVPAGSSAAGRRWDEAFLSYSVQVLFLLPFMFANRALEGV